MKGDDGLFINDVGSRLTDLELMEKFRISAAELRRKILDLIREGRVSSREVYWRPILYDYEVEDDHRRSAPRYSLKKLLQVSSADCPETGHGWLVDVNEKGGCVIGLPVGTGDRIRMMIETEGLVDTGKICFQGMIRWTQPGDEYRLSVAGFEIVSISDRDFSLLRELVRAITFKA